MYSVKDTVKNECQC